jgi:hypothetical protein
VRASPAILELFGPADERADRQLGAVDPDGAVPAAIPLSRSKHGAECFSSLIGFPNRWAHGAQLRQQRLGFDEAARAEPSVNPG